MNISACQLASGSFGFPEEVNRHKILHKHGFTGCISYQLTQWTNY